MRLEHFFDSSKIKTYMLCPRKFFFEYVLEWKRIGGTFHLEFGTAWHKAMEVLYRDTSWLYDADRRAPLVAEAYLAFLSHYEAHCETPVGNKTPAKALEALSSFVDHYKGGTWSTLAIELGGVVPISTENSNEIVFRIDALIKDGDQIWVVDHKTGSQNSLSWANDWLLSVQMLNYAWAAKCYYGLDKVAGVLVNGVFFTKEIQHHQVMVWPQLGIIENHLHSMNTEIASCKHNLEILKNELNSHGEIQKSFPRRTTGCTDYGTCPYHGLCLGWDNPIERCEETPPGFEVSYWDPLVEVAKAETKLTGMSKIEGLENAIFDSERGYDEHCAKAGGSFKDLQAFGEF